MQTQAHAFRAILEQMISEEIDRETEILRSGKAADFPEYKLKAGRLDGFQRALELCELAESELSKR